MNLTQEQRNRLAKLANQEAMRIGQALADYRRAVGSLDPETPLRAMGDIGAEKLEAEQWELTQLRDLLEGVDPR